MKCGAPLQFKRRSDLFRARKAFVVAAVFAFWLGGFALLFRDALFFHGDVEPKLTAQQLQELKEKKSAKRKELSAKLQVAMNEAKDKPASEAAPPVALATAPVPPADKPAESILNAGWVTVIDPWGHQVAKTRAALIGDGWLALPTRAAYAGMQWTFYRDDGTAAEISAGVWRSGEAVSLWHLAATVPPGVGLPLAAWKDGAPLVWMSLETQNEFPDVVLAPGQRQGNFIACAAPQTIKEVGVFVQGKSIVGWSFGPWLNSVYLWSGKPGQELAIETDVRSFYTATFANGREERLGMAQALRDSHDDIQRLTAFVQAFAVAPKLAVEDTPEPFRTPEAIKAIRQLVAQLIRSGHGAQVAELVNDSVLRAVGDIKLLLDLVPAIMASRGIEPAILLLEGVGRELVEKGGVDVPAVNELHRKLYQDWLQSLVSVKAVAEASQVLAKGKAFYPTDPYLHLLAVELALLNGDWQEAERLLAMMEYPAAYRDRAELLARKIAELKGDEGTIVIRFPAGGNRIPVAAGLGQGLRQDFLVDTGASMVTIPSATAEALQLQTVRGTHWDSHAVSTAGGMVSAREVLIETLEIEGWVEHNVSALVIDIPEQPGVGLLGMNYLNRFKMDVNTTEGKMILRPK